MIVGTPTVCAIESELTCAYGRPSLRGLGFFRIHLGGMAYGVKASDATLLACSFDQVAARLSCRGKHEAFFAGEPDAANIADSIASAIFGGEANGPHVLGRSPKELREVLRSSEVIWAPDGDEAFDDGSCVLQFDVADRVRLIGFRRDGHQHVRESLRDVWLQADSFYEILNTWLVSFAAEWASAPKASEE